MQGYGGSSRPQCHFPCSHIFHPTCAPSDPSSQGSSRQMRLCGAIFRLPSKQPTRPRPHGTLFRSAFRQSTKGPSPKSPLEAPAPVIYVVPGAHARFRTGHPSSTAPHTRLNACKPSPKPHRLPTPSLMPCPSPTHDPPHLLLVGRAHAAHRARTRVHTWGHRFPRTPNAGIPNGRMAGVLCPPPPPRAQYRQFGKTRPTTDPTTGKSRSVAQCALPEGRGPGGEGRFWKAIRDPPPHPSGMPLPRCPNAPVGDSV